MKNKIGAALKEIRTNKQIKLRELSNANLTTAQLSNIENGISSPSVEKFIHILSKLNIQYNEFIPLIDDQCLSDKYSLSILSSDYFNSLDIDGLEEVVQTARKYHELYSDLYFYHLESIASSILIRIKTNNFSLAREHLKPIEDYLLSIDKWYSYEFSLFGNCLYLFDIEMAIHYGNLAVASIKKSQHIYQNRELTCNLLNNLAIYCLDHKEHYLSALEFANLSEEIAASITNTQSAITSNVIRQVTYFKLKNGKFSKESLLSLLETYRVLGWHNMHGHHKDFIKKHGIELEL